MLSIIITYLAIGAVVGVLAGLLGIGGGLIVVPALLFPFNRQALPDEHLMHLALGTSMATIIFTSLSSFHSHNKRGAVNWRIVCRLVPGLIGGTLLGSSLASHLPTRPLKIIFIIFLLSVAFKIFFDTKPKPARHLPGQAGLIGAGGIIGTFASLVGIGGGSLSVPFLLWCNVAIHMAIGTASAISFPTAIFGTLGYIYNGLQSSGLPDFSLGFVYLPALFGIIVASVLTAPLGVKLSHALPVDRLKKVFAVLLIVVAAKMFTGLM